MTTLTISIPPSTWMSQNRAVPNHHARRVRPLEGIAASARFALRTYDRARKSVEAGE